MKRRHFLKNTATGLILPSVFHGTGLNSLSIGSFLSSLSFDEEDDQVLVMIYLAGGNDGLNTIIPMSQIDVLNNVRPHVALKENQVLNLGNLDYALHPAMTGLKSVFDEDRLAIIQNVGYPDQNYSHFRSTDIWMSGSDGDVFLDSGWSGRYLNSMHPDFPEGYPNEAYKDPLAIEIGHSSSLMFQGYSYNLGYTINDPQDFYELLSGGAPDTTGTRGGERLNYIQNVALQSQKYGRRVKEIAEVGNNIVSYPEDNDLAQQLKICARLISGGSKTKLYMVELNGFDTHDNQVLYSDHTKGEHAELLQQLSDAIRAFMDDCDALGIGDKVLGMTFSEFGRRIISNASLGTDHGSAAPLFLFGNKVKAGVYGSAPEIPSDAIWSDNLYQEFDFRQVYATLLGKYFCEESSVADDTLYGAFTPLDVIKGTSCTMTTANENFGSSKEVSIFPNPSVDLITINTTLPKGKVSIDVIDMSGRSVIDLDRKSHRGGQFNHQYSLRSLPKGAYIVRISTSAGMKSYKLIKG